MAPKNPKAAGADPKSLSMQVLFRRWNCRGLSSSCRRGKGCDKILQGVKSADLPVQQATKFEFVINLKAAKQIGLTLSPELLSRANRVIK